MLGCRSVMKKYLIGYNIFCIWVMPHFICIKSVGQDLKRLNIETVEYW